MTSSDDRPRRLARTRTIVKLADELDATPPAGFVRARNALAKRLRAAGRLREAADVARRRRPGLVPWIVNRLAHADPSGVRRLLEAADRLRRASLREPGTVPEATARHRAALHHLMAQAERILVDANLRASTSILRRVHATLSAAAADRSKHAQLREGRLTDELEPGGFAVLGAMPSRHLTLVKPDRERPDTTARPEAERKRQLEAAEREQRQALARAADAARRQRAMDRATRQAARLRERLRQVEERIARARPPSADRRPQAQSRAVRSDASAGGPIGARGRRAPA